ncbi:MAG: EamA family transporter [Actinomycetes bacterium]
MTIFEAPQVVQVDRRPALGYLTYLLASVLFSLNGTVCKYLLLDGIPWMRLAQLRVTCAFIVLLAIVAATNRKAFRLRKGELRRLAIYGVFGIAATQSMYFLSIERLPIGVSLIFEFTAPIMVALWFRFVMHEPVRNRVFGALVLALLGLAMVAEVWQGFTLDVIGITAAFGAAVSLVLYFVVGERLVAHRDPVSLTMWGFGCAAVFWAVVQPWWTFPWNTLTSSVSILGANGPTVADWWLIAWMVILGTVIPFALVLSSLRHLRATQASIVGMTEPLIASLIAFAFLGEALTSLQILGGAIVLCGVLMAETAR